MIEGGTDMGLVHAAGYGPPGGAPPGGYGPPGGGPPMGGPPGYGPPPGGYGPPPGGPPGYGPPPGGYGPPPPGGFGPPGGPPGMMMGGPRFNPLAITSLVLGILSIPSCCCWFVGAPFAIAGAGLVLGIIALNKIRKSPQEWKGGGMAIAGVVCASIGLILCIFAVFSTVDDHFRQQLGVGGASSPTSTTAKSPTSRAPAAVEEVPIGKLLSEYKENEVRADSEFKGKIVRVTGKVTAIKKDITDNMFVTLGTGREFEIPEVQCTLKDSNASAASNLSKGQTVTVQGEVSGLMMNVLLDDCDIVQ